MCRNIKTLRQPEHPPSDEEIELAALQYVRKISGFRKPSKVNQAAFDKAIEDISEATRLLLNNLVVR